MLCPFGKKDKTDQSFSLKKYFYSMTINVNQLPIALINWRSQTILKGSY